MAETETGQEPQRGYTEKGCDPGTGDIRKEIGLTMRVSTAGSEAERMGIPDREQGTGDRQVQPAGETRGGTRDPGPGTS